MIHKQSLLILLLLSELLIVLIVLRRTATVGKSMLNYVLRKPSCFAGDFVSSLHCKSSHEKKKVIDVDLASYSFLAYS